MKNTKFKQLLNNFRDYYNMQQHLIDQYRKDTSGTQQCIHFNNAGAALPPDIVTQTVLDYTQKEAVVGGYELAAQSRHQIQGFYESLARLLNTKPQNVAFTNHATDAYNRALSSIPFQAGDVVLTSQNDYVSNIIAFLQLQKYYGVKTVIAANNAHSCVDVQLVEELIKKHQPKLVAITHIPTSSGLIQDVEAIGQLCEQHDIWYLVDACQSVGQMEVDVQKVKCDFLSATGRKFLRGPRATGFLYVSDKVLDRGLEPLFLDLHSATWPKADSYFPAKTAKRFELWERNYALLLGLKSAIDYALSVGLEATAQRVQYLAKLLREQLKELPGINPVDPGSNLSAIVTAQITAQNWEPEAFKKALLEHKINTSLIYREGARMDLEPQKIDWVSRISVHYYNTESEIENLLDVLRKTL